jgi:signal transduction histidine kinase
LRALASAAVADARNRAGVVDVMLSVEGDTTVDGDSEALTRVLRNLLDNALVAAQPEGTIHVRVEQVNGHVEAQVADDGPGIPDHDRERIFERFVRLDSSLPGSGLGLAIARRIARQHGGDLTCDPAPAGASFTLRLPARTRAAPA